MKESMSLFDLIVEIFVMCMIIGFMSGTVVIAASVAFVIGAIVHFCIEVAKQ